MDSIELLRTIATKHHRWVEMVTRPENEANGLSRMEDDSPESKTFQFVVVADAISKLATRIPVLEPGPPATLGDALKSEVTRISNAYGRCKDEGEFEVYRLIYRLIHRLTHKVG